MKKNDKLDVGKAERIVLDAVCPIEKNKPVEIKDALNHVCAEDVFAQIDIPPFDRSPLDGFALNSTVSSEPPVCLKVVGKIFAGDVFNANVDTGCAVKIMTGAAIPNGCDCVIRQEDVEYDETNCTVVVKQKLVHHENYIIKGEDIKCGTKIFPRGTVLRSAHLAVLASLGMKTVNCFCPPRIAILSTGSELLKAGDKLTEGKIYGSNDTLLYLRLKELGFDATIMDASVDDPDLVAQQIAAVKNKIDVFISTGAVSVGEKDIFHDVFKILNVKKLFWGLNMKPGGATLCGIYEGIPLFCLSGNPFAAFVGFELLVRPALSKIAGRPDLIHTKTRAILTKSIPRRPVRRFVRAFFKDGTATPSGENLAGQLFSLCASNCLVELSPNSAYQSGRTVSVLML